MDPDTQAGGDQAHETHQRQEAISYQQAFDSEELKRKLSLIAESQANTDDDQDKPVPKFAGFYERGPPRPDDPTNPLDMNNPEHYDPIIKHCEQRLKHHSHQALHYFYEIIHYRKLAGLATDPPPHAGHAGDDIQDTSSGKPPQQTQTHDSSTVDRKWKLCEVHETGGGVGMNVRTAETYNGLLRLMFGKQDWEGEMNLDKLIDDDGGEDAEDTEDIEASGQDIGVGGNPLDELD